MQPAETPTAPTAPTVLTYEIQTGDTLSAIARRFNTTVPALIQANGLTNPDLIIAGHQLTIPTVSPEVSVRYHVVQSGETLSHLAQIYGVSIQAIATANNIFNYDLIGVGETLEIPAPVRS